MTECMIIALNHKPTATTQNSVGKVAAHVKLKLYDNEGNEVPNGEQGEAWVQSPILFKEYWQNSAATAAAFVDGWFKTGDIFTKDDEGYLWFVSRKKLLIIRGASNMAPAEIERALQQHPAINQAIAVGKNHPIEGQVPVAFVQLQDKQEQISVATIQEFLEPILSAYKVPEEIYFIESIPANNSGKADRVLLAKIANQDSI